PVDHYGHKEHNEHEEGHDALNGLEEPGERCVLLRGLGVPGVRRAVFVVPAAVGASSGPVAVARTRPRRSTSDAAGPVAVASADTEAPSVESRDRWTDAPANPPAPRPTRRSCGRSFPSSAD